MAKRPFPVDPSLTAISIAYRNPATARIGTRALPGVSVGSETFKYNLFPVGQAFGTGDAEVGRLGRVPQLTFSTEEKESSVKDYGYDTPIPQADIDEAARQRQMKRSRYDPRAAAVEGITDQLDNDREVRAASIVQDPNNYDAGRQVTLAGTDKFSDFENSDPYGVIDEGFSSTLIYRPNMMTMGRPVWDKLKRNPRLIKAVKGGLTEDGAITKQQFADLFEISLENLLIGEAWINTARKGQQVNLQRVWGNAISLRYVDVSKQAAVDSVMTWGFTAELGSRISGSIDDPDVGLEGGERIRVGERVRELVVAKSLGYLIRNPI